jgi:hypothetical protein
MSTKELKTSDLLKMAGKTKKNEEKIKVKKVKEVVEVLNKAEEVEDRDTKAKKTVEKLLQSISIDPNNYKKKVEKEIIDTSVSEIYENENYGNEWLEQQVSELTQENEFLRNKLATQQPNNINNYNNDIILEDNNVKVKVINLFMELQTIYMNVGFNYDNGVPKTNMIIYPELFMLRLIDFFPFLEDYRKIPLN